jgi:hypothetical protein
MKWCVKRAVNPSHRDRQKMKVEMPKLRWRVEPSAELPGHYTTDVAPLELSAIHQKRVVVRQEDRFKLGNLAEFIRCLLVAR